MLYGLNMEGIDVMSQLETNRDFKSDWQVHPLLKSMLSNIVIRRPVKIEVFIPDNESYYETLIADFDYLQRRFREKIIVELARGNRRVPSTIIHGLYNGRVLFMGFIAGGLYKLLAKAINYAGGEDPKVPAEAIRVLRFLKKPAHLMMLMSPFCPFCIGLGELLLRITSTTDMIALEIVNVYDWKEMEDITEKVGVPVTVVNRRAAIIGAPQNIITLSKIIVAYSQ